MKKIIDLPPLTTVVDISGVIPTYKLNCLAIVANLSKTGFCVRLLGDRTGKKLTSGALQSHELYFTANPEVVSLQFSEHGVPSGSRFPHVEAQ